MATVRYTVPDEVKKLFNTVFAGANKSAVISDLMRKTAERELRLNLRREAVDALLTEREDARKVSNESIVAARAELRH